MIYDVLKRIVKAPFHLLGLDLVRRRPPVPDAGRKPKVALPPLFDDPLEALCYQQGGRQAAFWCPLTDVVKQNGLSYSPDRWHPFVATLREYATGDCRKYEGSILQQFYNMHQPGHAADGIVGFDQAPREFQKHPAHIYRCTPWRSRNADEVDQIVRGWSEGHGKEHSQTEGDWSFDRDGFQYHGPVSDRKGRLEYRRLTGIYERLKVDGYDRSLGHAHFLVLRRGDEFRFLNSGSGNHRTAAMAALGRKTIPATFQKDHIVEVEMAEYWPQVRDGLWTKTNAEAYFHHLFDFDSRAWARQRGLLLDQPDPEV